MVTELIITNEGIVTSTEIYPAFVKNKAQLTYDAVNSWLEKDLSDISDISKICLEKIHSNPDLQQQIIAQDKICQTLRKKRFAEGALDFRTVELRPAFSKW